MLSLGCFYFYWVALSYTNVIFLSYYGLFFVMFGCYLLESVQKNREKQKELDPDGKGGGGYLGVEEKKL